jgi:hypothetical protein
MKIHIMKVTWFRLVVGYLTLVRGLVSLLEEIQCAFFCQVFLPSNQFDSTRLWEVRHDISTIGEAIFRSSFRPAKKMKKSPKELACFS